MNYPDLSNQDIICIDIETYDPNLKKDGPSLYREDSGYILGIGIATPDGFSEYYNLGHYDCYKDEREKNIEYLKKVFLLNNKKLGMHFIYDLDWIENWLGLKVNGQLYDIEVAEALIDENQGIYNLDFMSNKYLGITKFKDEIDFFCEENGLKGDSRSWLYKMPYNLVKQYAIIDVKNPLEIFKIQWKLLHSEDLLDLYHLECDSIRCMLIMRKNGVKIDPDKRDINALRIQNSLEEKRIDLFNEYGEFNYRSSPQIAKILDRLNIAYPLTAKNNPSITADYFKANEDEHPFIKTVYNLKKASTTLNNFLLGSLVRTVTKNNLIHCSFYNMRTDDYGTRSGRFSSANPNLQQIPSMSTDEFYGTLCREIFIPFENCTWYKLDYSQIEYRFMAHYAVGPGSKEIVDAYNKFDVDYHQYIMDLTALKRKDAKGLNFGIPYGMGVTTMSKKYLWTEDYCRDVLRVYHKRVPFMKATIKSVTETVLRRGYIKTILNRRSRLIDRDKAYTMFNRLMQGGAADLMKKAMVDVYKAGLFDVLHLHLTVHDELDLSKPNDSKEADEAIKETVHIMENCIKIKVPIKVDVEYGNNWALS